MHEDGSIKDLLADGVRQTGHYRKISTCNSDVTSNQMKLNKYKCKVQAQVNKTTFTITVKEIGRNMDTHGLEECQV